MTASEFEALPALLRRKEVMALAGVSEGKYYAMLAAANGDAVTIPGYKEKRIRKDFLRFLIAPEPTQITSNCPKQPRG